MKTEPLTKRHSGNAPGNSWQTQQGLTARLISPQRAVHYPHPQGRMDESRRWRSWFVSVNAWAVGPGWYEPGRWPIIFCMPQSLSLVVIYVIFSTKDPGALLDAETRPRLHAYLATVSRNAGCECYQAGGVSDHVHLAKGNRVK